MDKPFFVRSAGARDLDAVRALLAETWHATYDAIYGVETVDRITADWHSLPSLRARLEKQNSEFLVADNGSRLAGMAFAATDDSGETLTLHQLYVLPAFQGRGIGGSLMDEVLNSFPEARLARLEVEEANAKAIAFYEAFGFVRAGRTSDCGKPDSLIPALIYERQLGAA